MMFEQVLFDDFESMLLQKLNFLLFDYSCVLAQSDGAQWFIETQNLLTTGLVGVYNLSNTCLNNIIVRWLYYTRQNMIFYCAEFMRVNLLIPFGLAWIGIRSVVNSVLKNNVYTYKQTLFLLKNEYQFCFVKGAIKIFEP